MWSGSQSSVNMEAQMMLEREAGQVGIKVTPRMGRYSGEETYMGDEAMQGLQAKVRAAGGNPLGFGAGTSEAAAGGVGRGGKAIQVDGKQIGKDIAESFGESVRADARRNAAQAQAAAPAALPSSPPQMGR